VKQSFIGEEVVCTEYTNAKISICIHELSRTGYVSWEVTVCYKNSGS